MPTKIYIVIGTVVLVGAGGFLFFQSNQSVAPQESSNRQGNEQEQVTAPLPIEQTIVFTDSGYSPREVTIAQEGRVTFINKGSMDMWPATAIHPTHTIYPGSDIQKCNTAQEQNLFDACRAIAPGESWPFQFGEKGSWGFHDHLNLSHTGKIIVE